MYRLQYQIADSFPVHLMLFSNGQVGFVTVQGFNAIIDQAPTDGVGGLFTMEKFTLQSDEHGEEEFYYNTMYDYKMIPLMKQWLIQQDMLEPQDVMFQM